jgi:hypothetical protein
MSRPRLENQGESLPFVPGVSGRNYVIERRADLWMIKFDGDEFGPYNTEREALLFAIDAAQKLGERGECPQVLVAEEDGQLRPAWTFGEPLPPQN